MSKSKTLSISPTTVTGGKSTTGTVVLDQAAPAGGIVVNLSSTETYVATVPATVTIPAYKTVQTFSVATKTVTSQQTVQIYGKFNGQTAVANLTVNK